MFFVNNRQNLKQKRSWHHRCRERFKGTLDQWPDGLDIIVQAELKGVRT